LLARYIALGLVNPSYPVLLNRAGSCCLTAKSRRDVPILHQRRKFTSIGRDSVQ